MCKLRFGGDALDRGLDNRLGESRHLSSLIQRNECLGSILS